MTAIDAGRLLHRFTWPKHSTYSAISGMYVRHIHKNYHDDALVVFDGYLEASTKDEVHRHRQGPVFLWLATCRLQ